MIRSRAPAEIIIAKAYDRENTNDQSVTRELGGDYLPLMRVLFNKIKEVEKQGNARGGEAI